MSQFKVGDKVVAAEGGSSLLAPGKVYTVARVGLESGRALIHIDGEYTGGRRPVAGLSAPHFQLAPPVTAEPAVLDQHAPGAKLDQGKPQPALILRDMARALAAVVDIATAGAVKYTPGGWLAVPDGLNRYENAQLRHASLRHAGQERDAESGSLHLAHEAWNALAKLELYLREQEKVKVGA